MKLHRVLLFTTIQMDITPVGEDLHVLLTGGDYHTLDCTAYSTPIPDTDPAEADTMLLSCLEAPDPSFVPYVADKLCRLTGKNVLVTGGIYIDNPDQHQKDKLLENVDDIINDWINFYK